MLEVGQTEANKDGRPSESCGPTKVVDAVSTGSGRRAPIPHFDENRLLRSLPSRLRLMQMGMGETVPPELRSIPFAQMGKIADWIERETKAIDAEYRRSLGIDNDQNTTMSNAGANTET